MKAELGPSSVNAPISHIEEARHWLFDSAIPIWIEHGIDRKHGGFYDSLDLRTLRNVAQIKRLRVVTRQIFVFSVAARYGIEGASWAVTHGLESLFNHFRSPEGGFVSCCDLEGSVLESGRDLYDLAFTLFALAHAYSVQPDAVLRDEAMRLLNFVQSSMRHRGEGFLEGIPARLPRRQNPHMHLFEAALACAEYFGDPAYAELCHCLGVLFERSFWRTSGIVNEYYNDDLATPSEITGGELMEPGHHFEWIWLLHEYGRVLDVHLGHEPALAKFAMTHGVSKETNMLYGAVYGTGQVAQAEVRLWPHTEWLRAAAIKPNLCGPTLPVWNLIRQFLDVPTKGLWNEYWSDENKRFEGQVAPATTLYHLTTGIVGLLMSQPS